MLGDRLLSILAVGSVGRADAEGRVASRLTVEDYDLIVVLKRANMVERVLVRRVVARLLAREAEKLAVPIAAGFMAWPELALLPFTLFNYEMRNAYRVLLGPDPTPEMPDYDPATMPLIEATRLLLNRGVLLWGDQLLLLRSRQLVHKELQAVALRNRKVVMALGDALLIASGTYHWSYTERMRRARACRLFHEVKSLDLVNRYPGAIATKLSGETPEADARALRSDTRALLAAHEEVLGVVEEARLGRRCGTWQRYAGQPIDYPEYLARPLLKRMIQLWEAFGVPRGNGFYRAHVNHPVEEILLRAFPIFAYSGARSARFLRRYLNWPRGSREEPHDVWRRFSRAWATTQ